MLFVSHGYQKSVAWDMLRVYNDFVDAQERRRYYAESYLESCVLLKFINSFVYADVLMLKAITD